MIRARPCVCVVLLVSACATKLVPPPAAMPEPERKDEAAVETPPDAEPPSESVTPQSELPGEPRPDLAEFSSCRIEIAKVAEAKKIDGGRASCTYDVHINAARYQYTASVRLDGGEPKVACSRAIERMTESLRATTKSCKDLTATDRDGYGLRPK